MKNRQIKKIDIQDLRKIYYIDTVTCFEHPIAVALNYFDEQCSDCYMILAKLFGIYYLGNDAPDNEKIFDIVNKYFGIRLKYENSINWRVITEHIDKGELMIVAVNLYEIFYSKHYHSDNWGHWFLVNGYNNTNCSLNITDNTQFGELGHRYSDFTITYNMLKKASKSYRKKFYTKKNCLIISNKKDFCYREVLIHIFRKYVQVNINDVKSYRQLQMLIEISKLVGSNDKYAQYYIGEFKKKLININKYRELFFELVFKSMKSFNYNDNIEDLKNTAEALNNEWKNFILEKIIYAINKKETEFVLNDKMYSYEKKVQSMIKEYLIYLEQFNVKNTFLEKATSYENNISYKLENNDDKVIYGSDENIIFNFCKGDLYNWWIEDKAPKVSLVDDSFENIKMNELLRIESLMIIEITENYNNDEQFQAGFFVKTHINESNYICAVENCERWTFDKVGYEGRKKKINSHYNIFLLIGHGKIVFGTKEGNRESVLFKEKIVDEGMFEVGLVCKTWCKSPKLKVEFKNIKISNINYIVVKE